MKKRFTSLFLAAAMLTGLIGTTACGAKKGEEYPYVIREEAKITTPDYSEHRILPKPEGETQKAIQVVDLSSSSYADILMMTTLQGNVNRNDPSMYVLHDYMAEGNPALNATEFWLEELDTTYVDEEGNPLFTKTNFRQNQIYDVIDANLDSISGVVLYHERIVGSDMVGKGVYASIYSDVAILNLTLMMCGQTNAIAVSGTQYKVLKERFEADGKDIRDVLPILGDTSKFMKTDASGDVDSSPEARKDSATWTKVYEYALSKYAGSSSKMAMLHNPGFQAATFDYAVQNKLFIYNRSLSTGSAGNASAEENKLEDDILGVTDANTPVLGVWYLHLDEANYVNYLTARGKAFCVSYESFNWSWSTGLKAETIDTKEDLEIKYDPSKIYLAVSFTEGDNNSYTHFKMPTLFDSPYRGKYPFSWTIAPTVWESNPNIIKYFSSNWSEGDGLCTPESGPMYTDPAPPANTAADFYALCDEYAKRTGNSNIRTLKADAVDALAYAEYMKDLDSLLVGYGIGVSNNYSYNTDAHDFLFRGVPFITQLDGRLVYDGMKYVEDADKHFYSVSYSGWEHSLEDLSDLLDTLDERFVVVTQKQLAKLYRDAYSADFEKVEGADFTPSMTREEMGFLYKADNYSDFDKNAGNRYAVGKNSFRYKFDLSNDVTSASFNLQLSGNYSVEVSKDGRKFYELAKGYSALPSPVAVELPEFLLEEGSNRTLYVRFGDGTPADEGDDGVILSHLNLSTNLSKSDAVVLEAGADGAYLVPGENKSTLVSVDEDLSTFLARNGSFVYKLPLKSGISAGDVSVGLSDAGKTAKLSYSKDGQNYTEIPLKVYGKTAYGKVSGLSGKLYLKSESGCPVKSVAFSPLPEAVSSLSFRPLGNAVEQKYSLSRDTATSDVTSDIASQQKGVSPGDAMVYRFLFKSAVTSAKLELQIVGQYKISVSKDNVNYTTLSETQVGETADITRSYDVSSVLSAENVVYLKIEKSSNFASNPSSVNLRRVRVTTNVTDEWLLDKVRIETTPNPIVKPRSEEEAYLLDLEIGDEPEYYTGQEGTWTKVNAVKNTLIVYKFRFDESDENNVKFWKKLGLDLTTTSLKSLNAVFTVANSYKLEISGNGEDWTVIEDYVGLVKGGSNKKNVRFDVTSYLGGDKTAYVRFSRGHDWNGSDEALLAQIRLVFEVEAKS